MSRQLLCIACQLPIYRGQKVLSAEFGTVEQSPKSGEDMVKGYAVDLMHFSCIQTYLGHISGNELSEEIRKHLKNEIRKEVVADLREELKQEVYDEVLDELGRTCAVCQAEIEEAAWDDELDADPVVAPVLDVQIPQMLPMQQPSFAPPALPPSPFPMPNFTK